MTYEDYMNKKCEYKIMCKCRLCGETYDAFNGNNTLLLTAYEADLQTQFPDNAKFISKTYNHRHEDGSYGIGDFIGLVYKCKYKM